MSAVSVSVCAGHRLDTSVKYCMAYSAARESQTAVKGSGFPVWWRHFGGPSDVRHALPCRDSQRFGCGGFDVSRGCAGGGMFRSFCMNVFERNRAAADDVVLLWLT